MNIFDHYRQRYEAAKDEEFTLQEFLTTCRQDRSAYANAAERLLMAIGEPVMVDTAQEPRLSRLFSNRVIARYPAFEEFYGMEDAIEQIVSYLKHAAQGLEEKKQILYLLIGIMIKILNLVNSDLDSIEKKRFSVHHQCLPLIGISGIVNP